MEIFDSFERLCDFLEKGFVVRYSEYDSGDHCYYSLQNCLPFINRKVNADTSISLRDSQTGKLVHVIHQERDFEQGLVEITPPYHKVTLLFRSGYKYVIYFRKFD